MSPRLMVNVIAPFIALGASLGWQTWSQDAQPAQARASQASARIEAPSERVPFCADFVRTSASGTTFGTVCRAVDGSERRDSWLDGQSPEKDLVSSIHNEHTARYYRLQRKNGDDKWTSWPMDVFAGGMPVVQFRAGDKRLSQTDETLEGMSLIKYETGPGTSQLLAPALNFYPVVEQASSGFRFELKNIRLVTPEPDMFAPPAGAVIDVRSEKRGRILMSPAEAKKMLEQ